MSRRTGFALALFLLAAHAGVATSKPIASAVEVDTYDKFQVLASDIRSEMVVGGRYEFLKGKDRETVNQMLDAMSGMLQSSGSVADMPADARSTLMADQDVVNELLTRFADNRIICSHEAPIGSLIPKKRCRTLRQIEKSRSGSKDQMMNTQKDSSLGVE